MSAIFVETAHRQQAQEALSEAPLYPRGQAHLVLVPTGPEALGLGTPRPRVRLTRRGRLVMALLVASVVAVLGVAAAVQRAGATSAPRVITVQPGQTLWGIASRELPDVPVTNGIIELQLANSLSTSQIHVGQRLVIPTP